MNKGIKDWATKEIEIAIEKAKKEDNKTAAYAIGCYESALETFNTLTGKGHSGMSIVITQRIINRLIDRKPLTPIEESDDIWADVTESLGEENCKVYQCTRYSSLFKYVYFDGSVKYYDNDRTLCMDVDGVPFHYGMANEIVEKLYPITFPYMPADHTYKVCVEQFLFDKDRKDDFDTVAIYTVITPTGEEQEINKFYAYDENDEAYEITREQFNTRKEANI